MTHVTVECEEERIIRLECAGHAGKAEEGENVVCAAVSVLMQTCVNALEIVAGLKPIATVDEPDARIAVELPETDGPAARDAQVILRTTVLGLTDISHEYPRLVKLNILNGRNKP
jgi:uncharacterized protein